MDSLTKTTRRRRVQSYQPPPGWVPEPVVPEYPFVVPPQGPPLQPEVISIGPPQIPSASRSQQRKAGRSQSKTPHLYHTPQAPIFVPGPPSPPTPTPGVAPHLPFPPQITVIPPQESPTAFRRSKSSSAANGIPPFVPPRTMYTPPLGPLINTPPPSRHHFPSPNVIVVPPPSPSPSIHVPSPIIPRHSSPETIFVQTPSPPSGVVQSVPEPAIIVQGLPQPASVRRTSSKSSRPGEKPETTNLLRSIFGGGKSSNRDANREQELLRREREVAKREESAARRERDAQRMMQEASNMEDRAREAMQAAEQSRESVDEARSGTRTPREKVPSSQVPSKRSPEQPRRTSSRDVDIDSVYSSPMSTSTDDRSTWYTVRTVKSYKERTQRGPGKIPNAGAHA
ncbi:hypothetical protein BC834DRAFT_376278 [Gloeopeniophorella convolvens]|nr:hypothetical protein BC834DRAFT_376278 [Gloeopeniophorella convolvens]